MAELYTEPEPLTRYKDRRFSGSQSEREKKIATSTTLCGEVKRVIMGLDRHNRTPCGFCFVEYFTREDAQLAVWLLNGLKADGRPIRVDWDTGFEQGRQYGRGKSGGQVRDEWRTTYDPGRGGYGKAMQAEMTGQSGMDLWGGGGDVQRGADRERPGDRKRGRRYDDDRGGDRPQKRRFGRD